MIDDEPVPEHEVEVPSLTATPIVALCSCGWRRECDMDTPTALLMIGMEMERHMPGEADLREFVR